jgi:hypothetical protein
MPALLSHEGCACRKILTNVHDLFFHDHSLTSCFRVSDVSVHNSGCRGSQHEHTGASPPPPPPLCSATRHAVARSEAIAAAPAGPSTPEPPPPPTAAVHCHTPRAVAGSEGRGTSNDWDTR